MSRHTIGFTLSDDEYQQLCRCVVETNAGMSYPDRIMANEYAKDCVLDYLVARRIRAKAAA